MARGRVVALLVIAMLTACASGTSPAATSRLPKNPNPLAVTLRPDTGRAMTAFIPVQGGTVSAVAADGSSFSLEVPDGALLSGEAVTMTPVSVMDGLPFSGGMLASVDLAPAGLRLIKAATLTIKPSRRATKETIAFAYAQDGKEFHPAPFDESAGVVRIDVYHFSGEGVADGTPAEASAASSKYPPSSAEAQAQTTAASASADCKARQCDPNSDPAYRQAVEKATGDWFAGSVGPALSAAEGDDGQLGAALADWIEWQLVAFKLGVTQKFSKQDAQARASAIKGLQNALEQATKRCAKNYETSEIQNMFLWGGIAIKLGFGTEPGLDEVSINDRARKCATFELRFDSTMVIKTKAGPVTARRTATVPLEPDISLLRWTGSGQLNGELSWPPVPSKCSISIASNPATLTVPMATPGINLGFRALELVVVVDPDTPTSLVTVTCPPAPAQSFSVDHWLSGWRIFHKSEEDRVKAKGYVIRNWEWTGVSGPIVATKTYRNSSGAGSETTTLTFVHAPRT